MDKAAYCRGLCWGMAHELARCVPFYGIKRSSVSASLDGAVTPDMTKAETGPDPASQQLAQTTIMPELSTQQFRQQGDAGMGKFRDMPGTDPYMKSVGRRVVDTANQKLRDGVGAVSGTDSWMASNTGPAVQGVATAKPPPYELA